MEFAKHVDMFFFNLAKGYFTVFYGTDWYASKIKGHMEHYIEDDAIACVYKAFLQSNKETITEEDSEVCMNLIFNDTKLDADMSKRLRDNKKSGEQRLLKNKQFSDIAKEVFAVRCAFEIDSYSEAELEAYLKKLDDKSFFSVDIAELITMTGVYKEYEKDLEKRYVVECDKQLASVMKKHDVLVKISSTNEGKTRKTFNYMGDMNNQVRLEVDTLLNEYESTADFLESMENVLVSFYFKIAFIGSSKIREDIQDVNYNIITEILSQINEDKSMLSADEVQKKLARELVNSFIVRGYGERELHSQVINWTKKKEKEICEILYKYYNRAYESSPKTAKTEPVNEKKVEPKTESKIEQKNERKTTQNTEQKNERKVEPEVNKYQPNQDLKSKIDKYFAYVEEYLGNNRLGDAATNIRHILELIVNTYVEKYAPEDVFFNTFEKIENLKKKNIITEATVNTLHGVRKIANKGAHGEGDALSGEGLRMLIPPLRKEVEILLTFLGQSKSASQSYSSGGVTEERNKNRNFVKMAPEMDVGEKGAQCVACDTLLPLDRDHLGEIITCECCNLQYKYIYHNKQNRIVLRRIVRCEKCNTRILLQITKNKLLEVSCPCGNVFQISSDGPVGEKDDNKNQKDEFFKEDIISKNVFERIFDIFRKK